MAGTVLIFDDDLDLLDVCSIILKSKGYRVVGQSKCIDPLQVVRESMPDVILMDNWIPDLGGIKATRLIKSEEGMPNIPVIFFSANNNVAELASEAGADYYLQKPFDISNLEDIVEKAITSSKESN